MNLTKIELLTHLNAIADHIARNRTDDEPTGNDWTMVAALDDAADFIVESEPAESRGPLIDAYVWGRWDNLDTYPPL